MGQVYIATSSNFDGLYKIGRTSRDVGERMDELSQDDYGPVGFDGDSDWQAYAMFEVEDEVAVESALHAHFDDARLETSRELFSADSPDILASEVQQAIGEDQIINSAIDVTDLSGFLLDGLDGGVTLATGMAVLIVFSAGSAVIETYAPDSRLNTSLSKCWEACDRGVKRIEENEGSNRILKKLATRYRFFTGVGTRIGTRIGTKIESHDYGKSSVDIWARVEKVLQEENSKMRPELLAKAQLLAEAFQMSNAKRAKERIGWLASKAVDCKEWFKDMVRERSVFPLESTMKDKLADWARYAFVAGIIVLGLTSFW